MCVQKVLCLQVAQYQRLVQVVQLRLRVDLWQALVHHLYFFLSHLNNRPDGYRGASGQDRSGLKDYVADRFEDVFTEGVFDAGGETIFVDAVLFVNDGGVSFLFAISPFLSDFFVVGFPLFFLRVTNTHLFPAKLYVA